MTTSPPAPVRVAYLVMRYPSLSQTFLDREMRALRAQPGVEVEVHPCLGPGPGRGGSRDDPGGTGGEAGGLPVCRVHPVRLAAAAAGELVRLLGTRAGRQLVGRAGRLGWRHRPRGAEAWRLTLWGTVCGLGRAAAFRRRPPAVVHGAWATAPATAAAVLGTLCGRPFSFGAHAYDLFRHGGDPLLAPKLAAARFVHTTTEAAARHLAARFPRPPRRAEVVLARRGLRELPALPADRPAARPPGPARLLSVGRLVAKKGHRHQLDAVAELVRRGRDVHLEIIGEGPLRTELERRRAELGLDARVSLRGALGAAEVAAAYRRADLFWHTGIVDPEGDRDGLPNVVPEALAHALPVICSTAGGAAEAIQDGVSGLLVPRLDPTSLADAVERVLDAPDRGAGLGRAGRAWVEENFWAPRNTAALAAAFQEAAAADGRKG